MDRKAIITSLIAFDRPLSEFRAHLSSLACDGEPVAVLRRQDIAAVVRRYLVGQLDAGAVEAWANLIECREDVEFERRHEEAVADALFDLANPVLQGPLANIAGDVLASLER